MSLPRRLPMIALAVLLGAALLGLALCRQDAPPPPAADTPRPAAVELEGAVVLLQGRNLVTVDLADETATPLGRLPSREAAIASEGRVVFTASPGDDPTVHVAPLGDPNDATEVGPGTKPVTSPDGDLVAAVTEAEGYLICPQQDRQGGEPSPAQDDGGCVIGQRVATYDLKDDLPQEPVYALGGNRWDIVGWTDADRVVGRSTTQENLWVGFPGAVFEEQFTALGVPPRDVLALSPARAEAFIKRDGSFVVQPIQDEPAAPRLEIDLPAGGAVGTAAFSPDGSLIAAGVESEGRSALTLVDAENGDTDVVDTVQGEIVEVVWSTEGSHLAVLHHDAQDRFELTVCAREGDCRRVHVTDGATTLLALL